MNRTRTIIVGLFLVGGVLLFAGGLFLIGDRRLLFEPKFEMYTELGKVTGLKVGSKVRLSGLDAGEVLDIALPTRPSGRFRIHMRMRETVHPLVRTDSVGAVQTDGLVGNAFIQVSRGTDEAPMLPAGGTIAGADPVEFADLLEQGRDAFQTVAREMVELKTEVSGTVTALTDTVQTANAVVADVGVDVKRIAVSGASAVEDVQRVTADARAMVDGVRAGRGTVGQLFTDDALYRRVTGVTAQTEKTMQAVRETAERGRAFVDGLTARDGPMQQALQAMRDTMAESREVVSDLTDGTEALKRNVLFRGFFRDRGFFDLDAISREAYVGGALAGRDRTPLRIWIEADALFTTAPDGSEQLTPAGRRRLDSAMADFVRYPRDSPLVVEGYAHGTAAEAGYLLSADRGALVRGYLTTRFRRKSTLVDYIAMSDEAPGSPSGDGHWSGVALTLFVRNDALSHR